MELRQLRHFLALVEERSITGAAKRELIVQSGLSNSLQALERELGTELYLRGTRPVRLTASGEALLAPAREALRAAETARRAVQETRDVLVEASALDAQGRRYKLAAAELGLAYRHCEVPDDWISLSATFRGDAGDPD